MKLILHAVGVFLVAFLSCQPLLLAAGGSGASGPARGRSYVAQLDRSTEVIPHTVIVKFRPEVRSALSKSAVGLSSLAVPFLKFGVRQTIQMYPGNGNMFTERGSEIGLDRMYRIEYTGDADPITVALELSEAAGVEYAEPERVHRLAYVPNDAMISQQYALDRMKIKDAWDTTKGKPEILVSAVDSGVHWTHEDLRANLWINDGEDINHDGQYTVADLNGKDDDGNGYVDDIIGIDFAGRSGNSGGTYYDNDPLPTPSGNDHGTHTTGIMAAVGNNGKGIAGIAFQCRYIPVKCGTDLGGATIIRGYDGIVYAADMGAKVINCSWGGEGGYLQSEIDRIDYAIAKGAVVVAAAGNNAKDVVFTPACYPNVLSVASTGSSDRASGFTNYSAWVDVSAPGDNIMSTVSRTNSSYAAQSGTSMASPNAAGVVALLAAARPELAPQQLAAQVRVSSDNIDSLQSSRYRRKIGFGRVNAVRALTVVSPSVAMQSWRISDSASGNRNGILDRGEEFTIHMSWKNLLAPTTNAVVTISTSNPHVTIVKSDFTLGALATGEEKSNDGDPFVLKLADAEALNEQIDLMYTIVDGSYEDYGGVSFIQQPTYRDHNINTIVTTITNDGNLGFDDFSLQRGKGFIFKNNGYNVLFEGGLMLGAMVGGTPVVVDNIRNETGNVQNADFIGTTACVMSSPGAIAAQEGSTDFSDANAPTGSRLGVTVHLDSYEFTEPGYDNFVIVKYTIKNVSGASLEQFHAGLFFDWDISANGSQDLSLYDTTTKTGYAYATGGNVPTFVGVTELTRASNMHFLSINNPDADNPPIFGIHNGYTKDEKWLSLTTTAKPIPSNITDVSQVISAGPYTIGPDGQIVVAFALMGGYSAKEITQTTPKALERWNAMNGTAAVDGVPVPSATGRLGIWPQPARPSDAMHVSYEIDRQSDVGITVSDMLGRIVASFDQGTRSRGENTAAFRLPGLPAGVYLLRVITGSSMASARFVIRK